LRKLKMYLDTSVISHLKQDDVPEKTEDTLLLWSEIKQGKFEVFISEITIAEVMDAAEPKQGIMLDYLNEIDYTVLRIDEDVRTFAGYLNEVGVLTAKRLDDCLHIGCAVVNNCDMIISWNFRHIVRVKTINGVRYVGSRLGYSDIGIYAPGMIISREDDTDG